MRIFVAGTVLRNGLEANIRRLLGNLYQEIGDVAGQQRHSADLPYPDVNLDRMNRDEFVTEIQRRILAADSVISVLYPANPNVAFEAHFAAENAKPQVLLVDPARPELPSLLVDLPRYFLGQTKIEEMIFQLQDMVRESGEQPPSHRV